MANLITLGRFLLLFLLVANAYHASPAWQLLDCPLLLVIIALDGLDGYVARRRNETSVFGAIFDIAIDRVVENVLWVVLADLDLVSIWVALVFVTRSSIVDSIRYAGISRGETPFGMLQGRAARFLVASRAMRGFYGTLKAAAFGWMFLIQPFPSLFPYFWRTQGPLLSATGLGLVNLAVAVCLIRAIPVVGEFMATSGSKPRVPPQPAGLIMPLVLVDVDGTLYPGASSEALFIRHLVLKGIIGPRQALAVAAFAAGHGRRYGRHVWKINKAYIAGLETSRISKEARRFTNEVLVRRITDAIRVRIEQHRQATDRVMLLTGTPDFLAQPLADHLGIEIGAATLPAVLCGRFTSAPPLVHPFRLEKLRLAQAIAHSSGLELGEAVAYADSGHDVPLLRAVRYAVAVDPDAQLRRCAEAAGWEIVRSRRLAATFPRRGPRRRRRDATVAS